MIPISHIIVLSQPAFVERELGCVLSDSHPLPRLARWLGFGRRASAD